MFMETQWRGLQAPGKEAESKKWPFLINNGRANHLAERLSRPVKRVRHGPHAVPVHPDEPEGHGGSEAQAGDLVEVYNDNGSTQAMVYPTPTARPKQTFMLFGFPTVYRAMSSRPASTS